MDIGVLGSLELSDNGTTVDLTGPKRQALLTLLALEVGKPVGRERIVDALWPNERTGREESTLRVHVSHLRDILEPDRDGEPAVLVTRGSGYMLEGVTIDADRFTSLVTEAVERGQSDPQGALPLFDEALGLWRGRALEDVEYEEFAQEPIRRLETLRADAVEERAAVLIALDRDIEVIDDLEAAVRTDPTRDRPVMLLMQALYRTGRHADALRVAARHARSLGEIGLEPSPSVSHLETRILQHDPDLLPQGAVSTVDIAPGRSIRGYELRTEVGSGSSGVVFRAFQPSVGREVAIKVIDPALADRPEFVLRFAEEARIIARLQHPHIVPLYDFWREPSGAFLVMRWMDGGSLAGRTLSTEECVGAFGQIADALDYAHRADVVHRDLRPENILFDAAGNAYLCDFGLAVTKAAGTVDGIVPPTYAAPEMLAGEGANIASDLYALGALLAEAATGRRFPDGIDELDPTLREVVEVATAPNPGDRYPDLAAFGAAVRRIVGGLTAPAPRRVRRNPYKGLSPFVESDAADFYGRDDLIESLLGLVNGGALSAVIGASGSGKSSLVLAGLVPQLRAGALPGSDDWPIVSMVPGSDPFDEFHTSLRSVAQSDMAGPARYETQELRDAVSDALGGPNARAVLIIDQFEELFAPGVDPALRERFLDNLADLIADPASRIKVILTLRADFSDHPLSHPSFGELLSRSSLLVAPMRPDQIDEVIVGPAARVGVDVEPGLVAEIVRDVSSATAYLPLLQYVLAEMFETRTTDRLTVAGYRALGGVKGVLERAAETTYHSLLPSEREASRQLFLRMVHIGDHGEQTRRRVPLTEIHGLGSPGDAESALERFADVRLVTFDRDPVTRIPTVEIAHETVIPHWARYQVWIEEARSELATHRRIAAASSTWAAADEDPDFLLVGGPLTAAAALAESGDVRLNGLEERFVAESVAAADRADATEVARQRQEEAMATRARRRLAVGVIVGVVAIVIGVVAAIAIVQRQRANELAATQQRQSTARSLAASATSNLTSGDPDLSLLLAIEAAEQTLETGEDVLPEVVDALHRSVISPRPTLVIDGADAKSGGQVIDYAADGSVLAIVADDGDAMVVDPRSGELLGSVDGGTEPAFGVIVHPDGTQLVTVHPDRVRVWGWRSGTLDLDVTVAGTVTTADLSSDGAQIVVGLSDGRILVVDATDGSIVSEFPAHMAPVSSVAFAASGDRVVSGGQDNQVVVWDVATGSELTRANLPTIILPIVQIAWPAATETVVVATSQGETLLIDTTTGERLHSYGNGQVFNNSIATSDLGQFTIGAAGDGAARIYGTQVGGEAAITLQAGGTPLRDAEFEPGGFVVATVGVDGMVRIWRDLDGSELPAMQTPMLYPRISATPDGTGVAVNANAMILDLPPDFPSTMQIIDTTTGEEVLTWPTLRGWVTLGPAGLASDRSHAAVVGTSGNLEIVDVTAATSVTLPDTAAFVNDLAFDPSGSRLAAASDLGSIGVWDTDSGRMLATLVGHGDRVPANRTAPLPDETAAGFTRATTLRVKDIAWSPDGSLLASAGWDGTVRVWDVGAGTDTVVHEFDYEVYSVAFTPDGARVVASLRSGTLVELDVATGTITTTYQSVPSAVALAFSPDGDLLAGAGMAGTIVWDSETGRIVRRIEGNVYPTTDAVFVADGTQLLVSSGEGSIRRYLLDPVEMVDLARSLVDRSLTEAECVQYLGESCN